MTEEEKTLIRGCISGDKAAWDSFVQQYSNLVYHTIRKTLTLHHLESRDEVVEDLYQEFFVSVLQDNCRKLSQFRGDGGCTLASWLRVVASRLTIDFLRKQRPLEGEVTETIASDQRGAPDLMLDQEQANMLSRAIESLSSRDQLIIELTYHQGLPPQEIASILKISVGALYTQKSRILDKLRHVLGQSDE
jgi:RNA polymerase sigma-70 factor (ECF subfamily)